MKKMITHLIIPIALLLAPTVFAAPLFHINFSGRTLSITPTVANHFYPAAGIKVNTPGNSLAFPGIECAPARTGYCLFSFSSTAAKTITINGPARAVSITLCLNGNGPLSCQRYTISVSAIITAAGSYSASPGTRIPLLAQSSNNGTTWSYTISSQTSSALPPDFNATFNILFPFSNSFYSTNCSGEDCIAAGQYYNGTATFPLLDNSTDGGTTWTYRIYSNSATLPSDYVNEGLFKSSSCNGLNCIVAGQYSNNSPTIFYPLLANSSNGGVDWTYRIDSNPATLPPDFTPTIFDIFNPATTSIFNSTSCDGNNCLAAGTYNTTPIGTDIVAPLLAHSIDGGANWNYPLPYTTHPKPYFYVNLGVFNTTTCSGAVCVVAGKYDAFINPDFITYPLLANSTDAGTNWTYRIDATGATNVTPPLLLPSDYGNSGVFNSASCFANNCIAAGNYSTDPNSFPPPQTVFPLLAYSSNGGINWTYPIYSNPATLPLDYVGGGVFNSTSCTNLNCVAAGQYSNGNTFPLLAHSINGGLTWTYSIYSNPATLPSDYVSGGVFNTTNCNGLFCVAAGQYSNGNTYPLLAYSNDGGSNWTYGIDSTQPPLPSDYGSSGIFNATNVGLTESLLPESLKVLNMGSRKRT